MKATLRIDETKIAPISATLEKPVWELEQAVFFIHHLEEQFRHNFLHLGLTGSVLYGRGTGKDLDILVYSHDPVDQPATMSKVAGILEGLDFKIIHGFEKGTYPRGVITAETGKGVFQGKRIDFILMEESVPDKFRTFGREDIPF